MSRSFDVCFSNEAEDNIRTIKDWIAERSPQGAGKWIEALSQAAARLADSADCFGLAPEASAFDNELRQIIFKTRRGNTYRALFVIRQNVAHVLSVRGTGQDLLQPGDIEVPD